MTRALLLINADTALVSKAEVTIGVAASSVGRHEHTAQHRMGRGGSDGVGLAKAFENSG
jgi:hypothetical protein